MYNLNQTLIDFKDFYSLENLLDQKKTKPLASFVSTFLILFQPSLEVIFLFSIFWSPNLITTRWIQVKKVQQSFMNYSKFIKSFLQAQSHLNVQLYLAMEA